MNSMSNTAKVDYDSSSNASSFGWPSRVGMIVPTVSEEEQQGIRTNGKHLSLLPRSVRWRIQLGLLGDPLANNNVPNTSTKGGNNELVCNLESVLGLNRDAIAKQEERFKRLEDKYIEETAEEGKEEQISENNGFDNANDSPKSAEIDPLTAMVMEKEAQETRKAELYLKYRKEKAMMKRGLKTEARVIESESDTVDRASVSSLNCALRRFQITNLYLVMRNSFSSFFVCQ